MAKLINLKLNMITINQKRLLLLIFVRNPKYLLISVSNPWIIQQKLGLTFIRYTAD